MVWEFTADRDSLEAQYSWKNQGFLKDRNSLAEQEAAKNENSSNG